MKKFVRPIVLSLDQSYLPAHATRTLIRTVQPQQRLLRTPTPELTIGSSKTSPKDGMLMLYVPAGEFEMGYAEGKADEMPVHTVYLDAFWIDQTEITNRMYLLCVEEGVCTQPVQGAHTALTQRFKHS